MSPAGKTPRRPAPWGVLLDRDGTLVPDARYARRPEQLQFYHAAPEALRSLNTAGARLGVVSNQSAVARGLLTPAGLQVMDRRLKRMVRDAGARLDGTFYCPHHPEFTGPCRCRKPQPGLLRDALRALGLRPQHTFMVGDTAADLQAARALGIRTVLVLTGHGRAARGTVERGRLADTICGTLAGAARWILARHAETTID